MIALERAQKIAEDVTRRLYSYCSRIEVAGSVRRKKSWVNDIDLVVITPDPWNLRSELMKMGLVKMSGAKLMRVIITGNIQIDVYLATPETWATLLLIRTGSKESNIRLCSLAKKQDWHLAANGDGLFNTENERIAGDTEESIFEALGLPYLEPEKR